MGLDVIAQDDFSAGIVRVFEGQKIPQNGMYDCVNGLLDDDHAIYRRGGSAYVMTADLGATILGVWNGVLSIGSRTMFWTASRVYALDGVAAVEVTTFGTGPPVAFSRAIGFGGYAVFRRSGTNGEYLILYGGSLKAAVHNDTATFTAGSRTATGTGFTANVDPGMFADSVNGVGMVASIESNTSLTLREPWNGTSGAVATQFARTLSLRIFPEINGGFVDIHDPTALAVAGGRLIATKDNIAYFTNAATGGAIPAFTSVDAGYHELPRNAYIIGADSFGDVLVLFTTVGVFEISGMAFDATDAEGNPQHTIEHVNKDLVLWGDPGIAAYAGGMIVPAVDGAYLYSRGAAALPPSSLSLSAAITPLYLGYVQAGYQPGIATVHRGHYFLPILNGTTLIDVLVCRLDSRESRPGWTRWANHAGSGGYAVKTDTTTREPSLLGVNGQRVTDLTECFAPSSTNKNDADATTHILTIITRDYSVRRQVRNLWKYLRARFELTDAATDNPTFTAEYATGPVASESWTSMGSWAEGTGESPAKLAVGERSQAIRFRLKTSGPAAKFVLRSLEVFHRNSGRL